LELSPWILPSFIALRPNRPLAKADSAAQLNSMLAFTKLRGRFALQTNSIDVQLYRLEIAMTLVVDASILLAVLMSEPERAKIIKLTKDVDLIAPLSVHWEIGNALSSMLKRGRMTLVQAENVLKNYEKIPIRFVEVSLPESIRISADRKIYAYDAFLIVCARDQRCKLISLDKALIQASKDSGIQVVEVSSP
jgi:predicted nucleic acid-binding protein